MEQQPLFDYSKVPSPCYVIDEIKLEENLKILHHLEEASGAKILLALKAFSMFKLAPLMMRYLSGVCASGLHEATLGREEFNKEVHTYCAAFIPDDFNQILHQSNHLVFNSFNQWEKYKQTCLSENTRLALKGERRKSFGIRINPEHCESTTPMYDPCSPGSRMGVTANNFKYQDLTGIDGIHFHTLCEQGFDPLARTLDVIEENFSEYLHQMSWVNFGGGHHITADDYDRESLIKRIIAFKQKYNVNVYLEPGEAVALNAGYFVTEVLDVVQNGMPIAIMDSSATCHMPDVLEMPYRPELHEESKTGSYTYRLGGPSCLAGDIIGDYIFNKPLLLHDRVCFKNMAIYTMVKNTTFNGINLPSIAILNTKSHTINIIKQFNYQHFKQRLS